MSTLDLELALLRAKIAEGEPRPKEFDPNQPRDPHTGEWTDMPGGSSVPTPQSAAEIRRHLNGAGHGQNIQGRVTREQLAAIHDNTHAGVTGNKPDHVHGSAPVTEDRKILYGGHAGTPEDPVPAGADLDRAVRIIADGGHVSLSQPDEVATLLDKLRAIVKDAEAKGEDAPTYDLCNVSVPGTNLFCKDDVKRPDGSTIARIQMPQLSTKTPVPGSEADKQPRNAKGEVDMSRQFGEFLASSGLETTETTIDASHLRASQSELDGGKVAGIAGAIADGKIVMNDPTARIYVTEDNYVIDGHHRWAAAVSEFYRTGKPIDMPVTVVHTDIGRALTTANFWSDQMGIPPADVTKKSAIDPWLYSVAARTPELLEVVQKFAEPKHWDPSKHPRDAEGQWTTHEGLSAQPEQLLTHVRQAHGAPFGTSYARATQIHKEQHNWTSPFGPGDKPLDPSHATDPADPHTAVTTFPARARVGKGVTHAAIFETPDAYADNVSQTAGRPDGRYRTACGISLAPEDAAASDAPVTCKSCLRTVQGKDRGNAGNASSLIRWFNEGAGGAIAWGSPGDWAQCVAIASAHMGVEDAHGFCQNRHIEATGMTTSEHAHNDGKAFDQNQPRDNEGQWTDTGGGLSDAERDAAFEQREKADEAFTSEDEEGRKKYQGAPHFDVPAPSWTAAAPAEMKSLHDYLKKTNGVLYHGTSREGARDVLANGLQSDQDRGVDGLSEWELDDLSDPYSWDGVYLGKEDRASGFGDVLLAIDMKGMDDRVQQWVDGDALIYGSIPPDRISVVKGVPAKAFDPALHPHDPHTGQFTETPGVGGAGAAPAGFTVQADGSMVQVVETPSLAPNRKDPLIDYRGTGEQGIDVETQTITPVAGGYGAVRKQRNLEGGIENHYVTHHADLGTYATAEDAARAYDTHPVSANQLQPGDRFIEPYGGTTQTLVRNESNAAMQWLWVNPDDNGGNDRVKVNAVYPIEVLPADLRPVRNNSKSAGFDEHLHPRDSQGQFTDVPGGGNPLAGPSGEGGAGRWTREPHERLTALKGAWADWQRAGVTEMSSAQISALGDPRLEVTGYAGSILGGDPVAARWKGDHIQITAEGWDNSEPDTREFLLAHETSHAAAADVLANNADKEAILAPFKDPFGNYDERVLVFPDERAVGARHREEMMSDVGATLLTYGRDVLQQRFENQQQYDIGATPPDPRLVRLYDTVAEALDRVGNPPPAHQPQKAFTETLHPRYPAGTPGGLGGQFMPEGARVIEGVVVDDSAALAGLAEHFNAGDAMRDRAARVGEHGIHPGNPVHFISRNDGNYYHGTVTYIDGQGVHVNIPKQYGEHTGGNEDSVKVPEEIRHEADPIEIPPEAPTYTMANGDVIVGPWDPKFPDLARHATLIRNPERWAGPAPVRVLNAPEARAAIREDAAVAPPFVVGERVVATTGDVGILLRYGGEGGRGDDTASIRLDDGRVLADVTKGLQHAGTWETPDGWTAAGISTRGEMSVKDSMAHEVFAANDGSGRVYGITYPAGWKSDINTVAGMREALVQMIDNNFALEADTGLHNAWNGTLNFEVHQRPNVAATKEWSCSITIGQSTVKGMKSVGDIYWNPKDAEESRSTLIHELSHGLSDSGLAAYRERPGWEEGVVQAYTESYMAVEQFGRGQTTTKSAPGYRSYSKWVKGLDQAMFMAHRGDTYGDRLDWYRELLRMSLSTREVAIDQQMQSAGSHYRLELHGDTWNQSGNQEAVFLDAGKSAGGEEAIRTKIFAARTVEQATAALDAFESYASKHPDTSTALRMDAEWLVMFITAHEPDTGAKADFTPSLHPRDSAGRFIEVPGIGPAGGTTPDNYRETWKPVMTPEEGHAWARWAETKFPATVVHMTSKDAVAGIRGRGFNIHTEGDSTRVAHEEGAYFATDVQTAAFYEYRGDQAISAVVVLQHPLMMDWSHPEKLNRDTPYGEAALEGSFREAALAAAGLDVNTVVYDNNDNRYYASESPEDCTQALRDAGYDGVIINAESADTNPSVGGPQVITFDKEQAVVIGTEEIPGAGAIRRPAGWERSPAEQQLWDDYYASLDTDHPLVRPDEEVIARAFAKDFDPALHPRDDHGRFARSGLGAITAGNTDAGSVGAEGLYNALVGVVRNEDISNEAFGPSAIDNAAVRLKTENVSNIGTALAYRAKSDPELQAQLARAGDRLVRVAQGATTREGAPVTEHFDENGRLTGALGVYSEDHLHLREGMTREEVGGREVAAEMQDTWMNTATDSNALSWGLQLAVADRMGIASPSDALNSIGQQAGPKINEWLGIEGGRTQTLEDAAREIADSPAVKAYVDQVYNDTQNYLADNNITEISAYRGVEFFIGIPPESATAHVDPGVDLSKDPFHTGSPDPQDREVTLNPLSSFSTSYETAYSFSGAKAYDWPGGPSTASYVLETTFPAERVFSIAPTGPGCLKETEMLVIGGPAQARVTPIEHRSSDPGY